MAGQYNDQAAEKFQETKGECVQYVKLRKGNHYAITDWNPDTAPRQVTTHLPASMHQTWKETTERAQLDTDGRIL